MRGHSWASAGWSWSPCDCRIQFFVFLWHSHRTCDMLMWHQHRRAMPDSKLDLLQGTLDIMVLQTLATMGALHGYGIARRIEQVSGDEILLNQGTIYASLVRLQQRGSSISRTTLPEPGC